jgi:C1A family cysteine protease
MINKKIIFILIFIGLILIPFSFAQDNSTDVLSEDNSHPGIYFDASAPNDNGNGSMENPYKYLTKSRIADNSNIYLSDGVYELDSSKTISSYNAFIGKSMENTIITYNNAGNLFSNNGVLILNNLTIKGASIYNTNDLTADNVIFRDSYSDYGGSIYSLPANVKVSNSYFINNSAKLGGAICDIGSDMDLFNITAINNSAVYQGGAIYKMYTKLNLSSSLFINNSAGEGEAVFCDYSEFSMANNIFNQNNVYSAVNTKENFENNTFNQAELVSLDFYNINFESSDYLQMIYNPYNYTIPSSFDLRNYGWVTSIKNQGSDGNCWAFAAIAALESCILKASGVEFDLSEENMKNLMAIYSDYGWNYATNNGGTDAMVLGYFSGWIGPVNESDDRYIVNTYLSPLMESLMHVQNIIFLPRSNYTDNDGIKRAILDYGAVYTTLYATGAKNQYYSGTKNPDHAVVIIGWDDNYSKSKFGSNQPPGDGAWICKNSWGTNWGYNGYFYVSYYDTRFAQVGVSDASYTFILNDTVKYNKNYQYDVFGMTDYLLTNQSSIWYQNTFNATSDDIVAAFSTYFNRESNFTVEIYVNDELKLTQNGSSPAGYFTINLDEFIPIYKNDVFKIVIKLTTSTEAWVPISEKSAATRTHYRPNTSFISYDGVNWIDLYDYDIDLPDRGHYYRSQVACIKVFTIFNLTTTTSLTNVSGFENNWVNFTATVKDQYGHLINDGYVIFEYGGVEYNRTVVNGIANLSLNSLKYGYSNLTAVYMNNAHYLTSEDSLTIYRLKHSVNLTVNVDDVYYGDNFKVNVSLVDDAGNYINSTLVLTVGDFSYNVNSNSLFTIPDLFSAGNYSVSVVYGGDDSNYGDAVYSEVIVSKRDVNMTVNAENVNYGEYLTFDISLTSDSELINENVILNINGINYTVSANSNFTLPVILNASNYNVNVYYNGSKKYNAKDLTTNVRVYKINPNLEFKISDVKYGDDLIAEVKLTGVNDFLLDEGVILMINNRRYMFRANSNYTIPVKFDAASYNALVVFNGNANYNFARNVTNFIISKNDVKIDLFVSNITYGEKTIVSTYLSDLNDNLINKNLKLEIDGNLYEIESNCEFTLPVNLNASTYSAKVSFEGNINYNGNYANKSFRVNKANVDLNLSIDNVTYGNYLVIDNTINYDLILNIDNKNYTINALTINQIPDLLNAGDYEAKVIFNGDNNHYPNTQTVEVYVEKATPKIVLNISDVDYGNYVKADVQLIGINDSMVDESLGLTINNENYLFMANDVFTIPVILNASTYEVNVMFKGNGNYNPISQKTNVTVNKIDSKLMANVSDIEYTGDLIIKNNLTGVNNDGIEDILSLVVNDNEYAIISNTPFLLPDTLDVGKYTANITFNGNNNYNKANCSLTFNVYPLCLDMYLNISKNINNVSISAKLSKPVDEKINLKINNVSYSVNNGEVLNLYDLDSGFYSVEATFDKIGYIPLLVRDNFTIDLINTSIKADNVTIYYHEGMRLNGVLIDSYNNVLTNKTVNIFINSIKYARTTDNEGKFSLNLELNLGKYLAAFEFAGDKNYNYSSKEILVNIQSSVDSNDLIKYYRNASQYYATILDGDGNPVANARVEMNINGVFYYRTTNSQGILKLNVNLMPESYILTLKNPITGELVSNNITVLSKLVENHDLVKYYRNASKYSVKVLDDKGSPLAGANVSFNINGVFYTRQTNSDGIASLNINLLPGNYTITAQYEGLKVSNSIKVLNVVETEDLVMKYRDGSKFSAKVLDNQGSPYPNQSVTFNINGVFYTRMTNNDGVANLNVNLMPGKYLITTTFNGLSVSNTILINNV